MSRPADRHDHRRQRAGKTTLLKTITGLLRAQSGEVLFRGEDIQRIPPEQVVFRDVSRARRPPGLRCHAVKENLLLAPTCSTSAEARRSKERPRAVYGLFPC